MISRAKYVPMLRWINVFCAYRSLARKDHSAALKYAEFSAFAESKVRALPLMKALSTVCTEYLAPIFCTFVCIQAEFSLNVLQLCKLESHADLLRCLTEVNADDSPAILTSETLHVLCLHCFSIHRCSFLKNGMAGLSQHARIVAMHVRREWQSVLILVVQIE